MKMADTPNAHIELEAAIARVKQIAIELDGASEQAAFEMLWRLAFLDLKALEDFRIP